MARDERKVALGILVVTLGIEIALLAWLASAYGLNGAAFAAALAATLGAIAGAWALRGELSLKPVYTLFRTIAAGLAVAFALRWVAPSGILLLVAYAVAAVVYLALLFVLGEFSRDDIGSVKTAMGR
jgi:O-antigen/teichoic acid export membrane protein